MKLSAFVYSCLTGAALMGVGISDACADGAAINASIALDVAKLNEMHQGELPIADRLLLRKSERRLYLLRQNQTLRSYPVHLGLQPQGRKEYEGDFRTPEGSYYLGTRNSNSQYFLAIQVTYPNVVDEERARRARVRPGGAIMIHGLPNHPRKPVDYYMRNDWTDGCIAVTNSDMVEIWLMTASGLPIDIEP